jgi:hypothetical protein
MIDMTDNAAEIDPNKLYPFAEVARLLPSCRAGKRLSLKTLHRWRLAGTLACVERRAGNSQRYYFCWGSELLRLLGPRPEPPPLRSPAEARRAHHEAVRQLEAMGFVVGNSGP